MKARHILGLAVLMAVAGSCKKNQNQDTSSFSASIEVDESRTYLDGMTVKWSALDQIIVYGNGDPKTYTLSTGATTQTATFTTTGGVQPTNIYRAFYPASSCTGVSGDVFTFSMPAMQTYTANGFMTNLNPMAGKNDGNGGTTLGFRNAFAVAKFSTKGNRSVSKIELEVPSGNYVSGTFTFDFVNGTTTHSSGGTQVITLNCTSPVALNPNTANDFYFVLPPGSIDNGFTIRYYQPNSNTPFATKTVEAGTQGIALARNTIKTFQTTAEAQVQYVHNLLPKTTTEFWSLTDLDFVAETDQPTSTSITVYTKKNKSEGLFKTKEAYDPELIYGHKYYIRWYTHSSNRTGIGDFATNGTHDCYWPVQEPSLVRLTGAVINVNEVVQNEGHPFPTGQCIETKTKNTWQENSIIVTPLPADANHPVGTSIGTKTFRIDVNNQRYNWPTTGYSFQNIFSNAMLIDLTADFTNQGFSIPSQATLDRKDYFYGQRDITTW